MLRNASVKFCERGSAYFSFEHISKMHLSVKVSLVLVVLVTLIIPPSIQAEETPEEIPQPVNRHQPPIPVKKMNENESPPPVPVNRYEPPPPLPGALRVDEELDANESTDEEPVVIPLPSSRYQPPIPKKPKQQQEESTKSKRSTHQQTTDYPTAPVNRYQPPPPPLGAVRPGEGEAADPTPAVNKYQPPPPPAGAVRPSEEDGAERSKRSPPTSTDDEPVVVPLPSTRYQPPIPRKPEQQQESPKSKRSANENTAYPTAPVNRYQPPAPPHGAVRPGEGSPAVNRYQPSPPPSGAVRPGEKNVAGRLKRSPRTTTDEEPVAVPLPSTRYQPPIPKKPEQQQESPKSKRSAHENTAYQPLTPPIRAVRPGEAKAADPTPAVNKYQPPPPPIEAVRPNSEQ